jgi:phosphatidate cytidylyltransferase
MNATQAGAGKRSRELLVRALSSIILVPVVIAAVWVGGLWFAILLAVPAVLAAHEWTGLVHGGNRRQFLLHVLALAAAIFVTRPDDQIVAIAVIAAAWLASAVLAEKQNLWTFVGVGYLALPFASFVLLRRDPGFGLGAVLWVLILVWIADTFAYVFGRTIGGPKLAPRISPNKTWAGLLGAIVGAVLVTLAVVWHAKLWPGVVALVVLAVMLALIEQGGDLFESAAKRHFGVKDSGHVIPGHGGVLDRIDGLLAVAFAAAVIGIAHGGFAEPGKGLLIW